MQKKSKPYKSFCKPNLNMFDWIYGYIFFNKLHPKDINFKLNEIIVQNGKGNNDKTSVFPDLLKEPLQLQISKAK
ncbi:MAG: hypothetical protein K8R58_11475 [Bacteroidales bacterium]|nr:hypothetical protein [Bacteroidales bacterium]